MKDTFYTIGVDFKQKRLFRKNRNVLMHIVSGADQQVDLLFSGIQQAKRDFNR